MHIRARTILLACSWVTIPTAVAWGQHSIYELGKDVPGKFYMDLAIDPQGRTFLATYELDLPDSTRIDLSDPSSAMRVAAQISLLEYNPEGKFTVTRSNFPAAEQLLFGADGRLWIRSGKSLVCEKEDEETAVLDLNGGLLRTMAFDAAGNLWIGGLNTGLYCVKPDLDWEHYTTENSRLPSDSMTRLDFAGPEELWIALWYNVGVWHLMVPTDLAADELQGTLYDARSTGLPLQTVWTMISDGKGRTWFGSGGFQKQPASLVCFDRGSWSKENIGSVCDESMPGSVRRLAWDGTRLWVQVSLGEGPEPRKCCVATLQEGQWSVVSQIPENSDVLDLVADRRNHRVWVATVEKDDGRTVLHRFSY